jgi:hypothetical protein
MVLRWAAKSRFRSLESSEMRPSFSSTCCTVSKSDCAKNAYFFWGRQHALNRVQHFLAQIIRRSACERSWHQVALYLRYAQGPLYSITSSARASRVGGTSRPSVLAVLRLMTNSNLVGRGSDRCGRPPTRRCRRCSHVGPCRSRSRGRSGASREASGYD